MKWRPVKEVAACQAVIQWLELEMARALIAKKQAMAWNPGAKPRHKQPQQQWWVLQRQPQPQLKPLVLPHRPLLYNHQKEKLYSRRRPVPFSKNGTETTHDEF
jgi:hypothetical protein